MSRNTASRAVVAAALVAVALQSWGKFHGEIILRLLADGRKAELLDNFAYEDQRGVIWEAPKGSVVDGASIPQVFWTFIGGPWEGKYRAASVVHDVACDTRKRTWQDTHRMFYSAARLGGVGMVKAKVMYFAIYHWGPRWVMLPKATVTSEADFLRGRAYIERQPQIELSQIDTLSSAFLREMVPEVPPPRPYDPEP